MKLGLLDPAHFAHPCELAFDVFLTHRDAGSVAYLSFANESDPQASRHRVSGFVQTVNLYDGNIQRNETERFDLSARPDMQLPVADATCNLLVLRCAGSLVDSSTLLGALLAEVGRVLAPDGEMLLLWRRPAEAANAGDRVPVAASRWLARAKGVCLAFDRRWERLLRQELYAQGFAHSEWLVPEYSSSGLPDRIHVLSAGGVVPSRGALSDRLRVMALHSVAVRAARQPLKPPWLWTAIKRVHEAIGAPDVAVGVDTILVSPKEKLVLLGNLDGVDVVLRAPLSDSALDGCRQNASILQRLQQQKELTSLVPRPVFESEEQGRYFSVESRIPGAPMRFEVQDERQLDLVEEVLYTLNPRHNHVTAVLQGELFEKWVGSPLESFASRHLDADRQQRIEQRFRRMFHGLRTCVGVSHGDFSASNVYLEDGKLVGVIDWDDASTRGLPVLDAVGHLLSRQNWRGRGFADSYRRLAVRQWPVDYELQFLDRCYAYFSVEPEQHVDWVMLHWLHVVSSHSQHWYAQDKEFFEAHVGGLVDFFLQISDHQGQ